MSLEEAAQETHIKMRYLEALEAGEFGVMASHVQVRGFLRSYADYLGLDGNQLLAELQKPEAASQEEGEAPEPREMPEEERPEEKERDATLVEIGQELAKRRDTLGLSREDVDKDTRIPAHYLEKIEAGLMDQFPSPVQARGMLASYAKFLGFDEDEILARYADALQARLRERQPVRQPPPEEKPVRERRRIALPGNLRSWLRNNLSGDMIFGGALVLALVVFIIWGIGRIAVVSSDEEPEPTAPSLAEVLLPTATTEPTATEGASSGEAGEAAGEAQAQASPTIAVAEIETTGVQIEVLVSQRAWVRITVDGAIEFEGRVAAGDQLSYEAAEQIELLTGNAAALQVIYNGTDTGTLGIFGGVVSVTYTADGIFKPTATITPTPEVTATNTPTATPTEEMTPEP